MGAHDDEMLGELVDQLSQQAAFAGRLVEIGWISFIASDVPDHATVRDLADMRAAYFAGARHLFAAVIPIVEANADASEADVRRVALLDAELADNERRKTGGPWR